MDRRLHRPPVVKVEFLNVSPALQNICRCIITPITLEHRWLSMDGKTPSSLAPSSPNPSRSSTSTTACKERTEETQSSTTSSVANVPPARSVIESAAENSKTHPGSREQQLEHLQQATAETLARNHKDKSLLVQTSSTTASPGVAPATLTMSESSPGTSSTKQSLSATQPGNDNSNTAARVAGATPVLSPPTQRRTTASIGGQQSPREGRSPVGTLSGQRSPLPSRRPCPTTTPGTTPGSSSTTTQDTKEETNTTQAGSVAKDEASPLSTRELKTPRHEAAKGSNQSDRGRELARKVGGSKLAVQFSDETPSSPPRPSPRDVGHVMQFFAEQEKNLQESFLALPKRGVKKKRSPSPKVSPAAGLEHLDNLVRLMEQLGSLKDENSRLRQRCHYLESTKVLLQARKDLATFEAGGTPTRYKTMPTKQQKQRHTHHPHYRYHPKRGGNTTGDTRSPGGRGAQDICSTYFQPSPGRTRLSSADDFDFREIIDSCSDQRPKRSKPGLQTRSFSTGSLEVPSEILEKVSPGESRKSSKSKLARSSKSGTKSKSSKSGSKWARVKRVFTGQMKLYEDLGSTIRNIRDLGRFTGGSHSRYSTSGPSSSSPLELSPPSSRFSSSEHRPTDSGLGLGSASFEGPSSSGGPPMRNPLVVVPLMPRSEPDPQSRSDPDASDTDLTFDIWMGPPDWWEEYEARADDTASGDAGGTCGTSATNSDVGSVIEVTTMYLGGNKKDSIPVPSPSNLSSPTTTTASSSSALGTSLTASTISTSSIPTSTAPGSPLTTSASMSASPSDQQFLTVEKLALHRRQSSPSLNGREAMSEEGEDFLDELATLPEGPTRLLHKSSSCQSADLELPRSGDLMSEGRPSKSKSHRTPWGRVKDIIHTRKDSVKRRPKKQRSEPKSGIDSEETSEIDLDGLYLEEQWRSGSFGENLLSRSTPKSSPSVMRQGSQQTSSGTYESLGAKTGAGPSAIGGASGRVDMAALLAGTMSDEFSKKMQEWEAIKTRKSSSFKGDDSDINSLDMSGTSTDIPAVRTVDLRDLKGKVPESSSDGTTPGESRTSLEVLGAPTAAAHLEEVQRRMTESFSRKMQEWERLKYKTGPGSAIGRETSPDIERKGSKGRKDERQKSKRSREEKEKEKMEKMREREKQKVEKEELKLEKEKLRLEKERLRALEREAKLEKLKGRLSNTDMDSGFKNPVLGPLAEYKVTADFAHKLHQWELKKGLSHDVSNSIYLEAQKLNVQHLRHESTQPNRPRFALSEDECTEDREDDKSPSPQPLPLQAYWDTPENRSPVEKSTGVSLDAGDDDFVDNNDDREEVAGDDETATSVTEECLTKSNIVTLERANQQLIENLQQKEMEYADVQQQVQEVNQKLAKVKDEHAKEMARFHRELALGSIAEPVKLEVGELEGTIASMEDKIKAMENLGERLAVSMESSAVGKWQSIDGEETVHSQLVRLVDQMRNMLIQASHSEEQSKKSMALTNFEQLYSHAMKLQVQMNNLRLSHLERNREIMMVKRQLLLQEVNNLLLQADITRRETELYQFQAAKKFASLRRWNTFSGSVRSRPQAQMEVTPKPTVELQSEGDQSRQSDAPYVTIPYISEDVILASAASSSISAPASPSAVEAAGGAPRATPGSQHSDHHQHLLLPGSDDSAVGAGVCASSSVAPSNPPRYDNESKSHTHQHSRGSDEGNTGCGAEHKHSGVRFLEPPDCKGAAYRLGASTSLGVIEPEVDTNKSSQVPYELISPPKSSPAGEITLEKCEEISESIDKKCDNLNVDTMSPPNNLTPSVSTTKRTEITTMSDSAPLYKEIKELRKAKKLVERGSPTLILSKEGKSLSAAPSPVKGPSPNESKYTGTLTQTIPQQPGVTDSPLTAQSVVPTQAAAIIDYDISSASTVMDCTKTVNLSGETHDQRASVAGTKPSNTEGATCSATRLSPRLDARRDLPLTSDSIRHGVSKCPRSPVTKHNYLRRQKEDRDGNISVAKHIDYKAISPKGSPIATRGKPPLPRQNTPVRQSPHASPMPPDKGPRSKSVGEMSHSGSGAASAASATEVAHKPLQDAINKFEKRQTMCETEERPVELRKTPSPTLHLPRVGLVSRVRRVKPPAELLEESQRYRSGHTIYATRIMHRYLPRDESRSLKDPSGLGFGSSGGVSDAAASGPLQGDKENTFVHAIVRRLSRENSPAKSLGSSRTNSEISLKRTDSNRSNSELVSHLVRKLSNGSRSGSARYKNSSASSPLKDRTNGGHVKQLAQSFDDQPSSCSPERTLSDSEFGNNQELGHCHRRVPVVHPSSSHNRKSCEVAMVLSPSTAVPTESSFSLVEYSLPPDKLREQKQQVSPLQPSSEHSPTNHQSLPALLPSDAKSPSRGRAATYCPSDQTKRKMEKDIQPARPASISAAYDSQGVLVARGGARPTKSRTSRGRSPAASLSPVRRGGGRGRMGTVGVLCKQSISFDLGVSLYTQQAEEAGRGSPKWTRQVRSWDPSESVRAEAEAEAMAHHASYGATASSKGRPISSGSEGDAPPSSPPSEEKNKFRRFLDSSWLQKSKKFFKVSK